MKSIFCLVVYFLLFLNCILVHGQDVQFSQYYNTPLYTNPAFAGTGENTRVGVQYRTQWTNVAKPYTTYALWGDHFIESARSGVGLWIMRDDQGQNRTNLTAVNASYSYVVPLGNHWVFRPGLQVGFGVRGSNYNTAVFGDQLTNNGATGNASSDPILSSNPSKIYPDFGTGGMIHNDKFWFGLGLNHLNTPNLSVDKIPGDNLPMLLNIQSGYKILLNYSKYNPSAKEISLTPTVNYKHQGTYDQLDIGCYYTYSAIMLGMWYRGIPLLSYGKGLPNNEAIIPMVGLSQKGWSITYSYDYTISKLTNASSGGSHEVSIIYEFKVRYRNAHIQKRLPCPKFNQTYSN